MGVFLFSQIYCTRDSSENKFLTKRTTYTVAKYLSVIQVQVQGICFVGEQVQVPWSLWLCFWCFFLKIIDIKFINYDRLFAFLKKSLFDTNTYVTFNLGFYY